MPNNLATYREMSIPFQTPDAANEAIRAFFEDLGELRKKHKIRDLICVLSGSCLYPKDGEQEASEGEFITDQSYGASMMREVMAAWLIGTATAEHRERINTMMTGEKKKKQRIQNGLFD